jgi:tetratricopeptide (TPR) repeat protein
MPDAAPKPSPLTTAAGVALIFALAFACYWPALSGAVLWDDPAHLPRPDLRSWAGLGRIWFELTSTQQYYPVLFSAFWLEHRLWGDHVLGYHLVNVVFHASSCVVFALLLRRLWSPHAGTAGGEPAPRPAIPPAAAWIAAALFAVHPVCVESVAWITEQKNTLSLLFYLLAALVYLRFAATRRPGDYVAALALFLLALGSKTVTVTLPGALLVVLWWKNGKLAWRRDVLPLLPWFLASACVGALTSWVERKVIGAEGASFDLSLFERTLLAGRAIWFYAGKLVWPADLMFFYPRWDMAAAGWKWAAYPLAALAMTVVLWRLRRRTRGPLAAWLLFLGGVAPVLGFFNVFFFQFSYVNDHFLYVPSLGPIALAAAGWGLALTRARGGMRPVVSLGCAVLVAGLAFLANRQSALYRDNETLFRHAIARNPDTWMGHHILGFALAKTPAKRAEAITQFEEAIRLNPSYPDAYLYLAIELTRVPGRSAEAIPLLEHALGLRPHYVEAHNALGIELARQPARVPEAIAHFETALQLRPDFAEAHFNLANVLAGQPARQADALRHYEEAVRLSPEFARAHVALAFFLSRQAGREADAIRHYQEALRLNPRFLEAYNGLGIVYAQQGQLGLARQQWETALQIDPGFESARRNLRLLEQNSGR